MAALLFYGHLPLQGCFRCPHCSTRPLVMWKWMTNRNLLTPPRCPASVISRAVFNRSEFVRVSPGRRPPSSCLLFRTHATPHTWLQLRSCERDAGTLAKPRHPLRAQRRLITCRCWLLSTLFASLFSFAEEVDDTLLLPCARLPPCLAG